MPSQTSTPLALPIPRKRLSLLTSSTLGQDVSLYLNQKVTKSPYGYTIVERVTEDEYHPPAPPPPSPVSFPSESWSTALRR
ncbi:hypothetical protein PVAG01_03857 [Phlyctema vagabunda]|uniref:Uncharacterized protein n=1 Tax=Phlyctema vagabunda TaxID=108571 RepID=A0ABR4PML8_9HELO